MECAVLLAPVAGKASGNSAFTLKDFLCQDMLSYALIQDGENKKLIWLLSKRTASEYPNRDASGILPVSLLTFLTLVITVYVAMMRYLVNSRNLVLPKMTLKFFQ